MILVVDIGTSVLKAGIASMEGELVSGAEVPVSLIDKDNPLFHEADASSWISSLASVIKQMEYSGKLKAVVISGNGPTLVPVGETGKPLDNAITWMDRRGVKEAKKISEITGYYIDPTFYLPKAYWIFRNKPKVYENTRYFLACPEYVSYFLTGSAYTILPADGFERYIWTVPLIEKLGMDPEKFPPFIKPGEPVGKIRKEAEEVLGIASGTPVFAGAPDFVMTLLGTATVSPGRVCDRSGTSEGINLCSKKSIQDKRLLCLPHIIDGLINISGIISTSGRALSWFKKITGRENLDYETLFEDICQVPSGSNNLIFLPYLAGERAPIWDPFARGCFIGLTVNHGRKEMSRAVVEAIGYAIRDVIEVMEENDLEINELRITGGQAKSPLWNQIKADITGKKILVPEVQDSELIGDACVGLYSLGEYKTLSEASENIVKIKKEFTPRPEVKNLYDDLFTLYRESYKGLKQVFKRISEIQYMEEL